MRKTKVLFVCGQNTARSQMAEAFLKELGGDAFEVESAGLEAGPGINPLAVEVMKEVGLDISNNEVTKVFDLFVAEDLPLCHLRLRRREGAALPHFSRDLRAETLAFR
jgi:protein-tyrosine-phosphatase